MRDRVSDRLLTFITKLVLLVAIAVAAAPLGAIAVGDPVIKEFIKAAVVALTAVALQYGVDQVRDRRRGNDPYAIAGAAHHELLNELAGSAALDETPSYEGEHSVIRIRLMVRCCAARVAAISLAWDAKPQYWELVDEVEAANLDRSPARLAAVRRKLDILSPPQRP